MNLNELIKKAHKNAVKKGFYGSGYCPDCKNFNTCNSEYKEDAGCCDFFESKSRNTGELLMLIVSELGEALEAHRKGIHYNFDIESVEVSDFDDDTFSGWFRKHGKDTFQDEIADVFIRLFDFCGYMKIEPVDFPHGVTLSENVGEGLLEITHMICEFIYDNENSWRNESMYEIFHYLQFFCEMHKIDIEKHIELKMRYNETRDYKHGKRY